MRRRDFMALVSGVSASSLLRPLAAHAQQATVPVVGLLGATTAKGYAAELTAFRQGLNEVGYVEGHNVLIEYRWAEDQYDQLPTLAADLVRHKVTVIAAMGGNVSALAAKSATATIPIVFHTSVDPVEVWARS